MPDPLIIVTGLVIPACDLEWKAVLASGPGGQNVNKVASAVELRFTLAETKALAPAVKERLARLAGRRLSSDGWLTVESRRFRDQARNLADAREKLRTLIEQALVVPVPRRPTRPTWGSRRRRRAAKERQSARKRDRRPSVD